VTILVLRHVDAGDRAAWEGEDRSRPVSPAGLRQAIALVDTYADRSVTAVLSSPYRRCVQSVEPLAAATGTVIEEVDELAEGAPFDGLDRLLRDAQRRARETGGAVVVCSHGDVIGMLVTWLEDQGVALHAPARWPKASTWVIEGDLAEPEVAYLGPPA
jgi:8-oxo-dGTP diphosphatase